MASSPKVVLRQASSNPDPSQSDLLDQNRLPKRLFKINRQQQELLGKADSWAQHLARQPKPGVNLPPEVLENLRRFYRRQTELLDEEATAPTDLDAPNRLLSHTVDRGSPTVPGSPQPASDQSDNEVEDGEPGTPIPWSSSPVRDDTAIQEEHSSPHNALPQRPHDDTNQPFLSQIPARSPLQPTLDACSAQRKPVFNDFPSSSLGPDAELEVVAPGAFIDGGTACDKATELNPTPPSAQIQVPCTFDADSSIPDGQPKTVVVQPCRELASLQKVQERVKWNKPATAADIPDSQSSVDSTSSVIPATNLSRLQRSPVKTLRTQPLKSTVKETPYADRKITMGPPGRTSPNPARDAVIEHDKNLFHGNTPDYRSQSPGLEHSHPIPPPENRNEPRFGGADSQASSPRAPSCAESEVDRSPFLQYCLAYPSYIGSLGDFVSACMSIQKRRLAPYQYDDFIRAWSEGYLKYVSRTIEASGEPWVAVDWYMNQAEDFPVSWQAQVVTKANLDAVLEVYPEEVAERREAQHGNEVQALSSSTHGPARDIERPPGKNIPNVIEHGVRDPPQKKRTPNGHLSTHVTHEQGQSLVAPRTSTYRYGSPSAQAMSRPGSSGHPRKRRPVDDIDGDSRKREPPILLPMSETSGESHRSVVPGSTVLSPASTPPRSSQPPLKKRKSNGPKEYDPRDFRAFLAKNKQKKEKMNDDISVASSAPISATPASGQRKKKPS